MFGQSAQVNVGALVASTLELSDANFLANHYAFANGGSAGSIINSGSLNGKVLALIAPQVINAGTINAPNGALALAAGEAVNLDFSGDGLMTVEVSRATLNALAENDGLIQTEGGLVIMTAHSANALLSTVVNNTGIIRAKSLQNNQGRILLEGGDTGITQDTGLLDVSGIRGGQVVMTGNKVGLFDQAEIDGSGTQSGGQINVGGSWEGQNSTIHEAINTYVAPGAVLNASATQQGKGGEVVVRSDIHNTASSTQVYGTLLAEGLAEGGDGGRIETSGYGLDVLNIKVSAASSQGQAGQWLLDPFDVTIGVIPTGTLFADSFTPLTTSTIAATSIAGALAGGSNVTV